MKVYLDGQLYELKAGTGVARVPVQEFNENLRLTGQQSRFDRSLISTWAIDKWDKGFGVYRMDSTSTEHASSFWDMEYDTRTPGQLIHGALPIQAASVGSWADMRYHAVVSNQLVFIPGDSLGTIASSRTFKYVPASNTLATHSLLTQNVGKVGGILGVGDNIYYAKTPTIGQYNVYRAVSFASDTVIGTMTTIAPNDVQMGMFSNKLYLFSNTESLQFDNPQTTPTTALWRTCGSFSTVAIGTAISPLQSDGISVYAGLPEGIWDISPSLAENVLDSTNLLDSNALLSMYGGNLILKNYESLIAIDPNTLAMSLVGLDKREGLPLNKKGQVTAMCSSYKSLFAAVQGGGSYSSIFSYDGVAWSFLSKIPSLGASVRELFLSSSPDGIQRLWMMFLSGNPCYLLNPDMNPLQAGTYSYIGSAYGDFPYFDGGMPDVDAGFYDWNISVEKVGTPAVVQLQYGLDFGVPTSLLGTVATTSQQFLIGSYGVTGRRIQPRLLSTTTSSGTTPIIRDLSAHYFKVPNKRESFQFTVDLRKTAVSAQRPLEEVIGSLSYISSLKTLSPFFYGRVATKNVRVVEIPALESIPYDGVFEDEREGFVDIKLMEMI